MGTVVGLNLEEKIVRGNFSFSGKRKAIIFMSFLLLCHQTKDKEELQCSQEIHPLFVEMHFYIFPSTKKKIFRGKVKNLCR